jgi:type II secretory pathway pseudopilin PulG
LAQAEHQLASYGRSVVVAFSGVAMTGVFMAAVIAALVEFGGFPPRMSSIVIAAEVGAWQLKLVALPAMLIVLWISARIMRSIKVQPARFIGLRAARMGFTASVLVILMIATLIGVTIPKRLQQRREGIEAGIRAQGYTLHLALIEYRERHGTLPLDSDKLIIELRTLPDPDGSLAEALNNVDPNGYQPGTVLAAASNKGKTIVTRGSAIRSAANSAGPTTDRGVSFTSYELHLPGPDKILNTDDDFIVSDGVVEKVSEKDLPSLNKSRPPIP